MKNKSIISKIRLTTAKRKNTIRKKSISKKPNIGFVSIGKSQYKVGTSVSEKAWLDKLLIKDRQKVIYGFNGKIIVVDGINTTTRTIYEYLGEHCHSIRAYPKEKWDIKTWMGKTPREMYNATINRFLFLQSLGWKVFFVWHKDFKKGKLGRYFLGKNDTLY